METYYNPEDLAKFGTIGEEAPQLAEKFFDYYGAVFAEGALTAREKSLIALAVAHAVQCPYCIDSYTNDCLNKGVSEEQMTEAVHVAAAIRGGATLVHGVQMKNIVKKLYEQLEKGNINTNDVMNWFEDTETINHLSEIMSYDFEISDVDKAIDDVIFTYKKESLVNRRNTILKEIESVQNVEERQNLEKELNDVIIQLAKMK